MIFFLSETGRAFLVDLTTKIELIQDESTDFVAVCQLSQFCEKPTKCMRGM